MTDINENIVTETESTDVVEPETTEHKVSSEDYKLMVDMVKEVDDQYKILNETLSDMMKTRYGLDPYILTAIITYGKEEIKTMNRQTIVEILNKYVIDPAHPMFDTNDENCDVMEIINNIKDASLILFKTKIEADDIKKNSSEILKDYFNYMTSDRIRKSREARLSDMKEMLKVETNEVEINKIKKMIETMESTLNFYFIKERFDTLGKKELESIKKGYFDLNTGSYIIKRFKERITKFGYNENIYKYFFNIEENFLAKKYSPFNNLFLFIYMRFVGYSDPYNKNDKMMVQALTGAISNLIYHKFDNLEGEQFFISIISEIIDKFADNEDYDYTEYFKTNNTTYEEHPARKEIEANHEKIRKEAIIKNLKEMRISNINEDMTADELQDIYNKEVDLMIRNQIGPEENEKELEIEESEAVEIEPTVEEITKVEPSSVYGEMLDKEPINEEVSEVVTEESIDE